MGLRGAWQAQRRRLHELMFAEHSLCARFHSCCSAHTSLFHLPRDLGGSYYHCSFVYRGNKHSLKPIHKLVAELGSEPRTLELGPHCSIPRENRRVRVVRPGPNQPKSRGKTPAVLQHQSWLASTRMASFPDPGLEVSGGG